MSQHPAYQSHQQAQAAEAYAERALAAQEALKLPLARDLKGRVLPIINPEGSALVLRGAVLDTEA